MNSNELVRVLPAAISGIIESIYKRHNGCQADVARLMKAQTEFITMVAKGQENEHDIEFWNAMTFAHRRQSGQFQFDAIQFYLGIRLGDEDPSLEMEYRFKKREFLKRFYLVCFGNLPEYSRLTGAALQCWEEKYGPLPENDCVRDQDLDYCLDRYGATMLPGYKDYKDVIKMKWNNPLYQFPEDLEMKEHVRKRMDMIRIAGEKEQREKETKEQREKDTAEIEDENAHCDDSTNCVIGYIDGIIYKSF